MNNDCNKGGVFLSRPTWIAAQYEEGLEQFLSSIEELGYEPRTLGTTEFAIGNPLDKVIEMMKNCKGVITLGYPQIFSEKGAIKDIPKNDMHFCTEWNHVEAAIGHALGLPVFIIYHNKIEKRGVFAPNAFPATPYELNLSFPEWSKSPQIQGALREWAKIIERKVLPHPLNFSNPKLGPTCPNCSTETKQKYLSRLTEVRAKAYGGASHSCTDCGYII